MSDNNKDIGLGTTFDLQALEIRHYKAADRYASIIASLMYTATEDIAKLIQKGMYNKDKPFEFKDYPQVQTQVSSIVNDMVYKMQKVIGRGVSSEWMRAVKKSDAFIESIINTSKLTKKQVQDLKPRNLQALKSFQDRKVRGMELSARIWEVADQYKSQIEFALDVGIGEGKGALELARDIKTHLKNPDKLFRRVRDKRGNLQLSKAAKAFNPGQGKYRSSVRNAQRVARTETNAAYRESDYQRWQSMDIILGFEVRRSKRDPVFKCKVCEKLVGRYPKTFKFTGWHPNCMCYAVPILISPEELAKKQKFDLLQAVKGTYKRYVPSKPVTELPDGYKEWISDNAKRMEGWSSKPYFIKDNYVDGDISKGLKYSL